MSIPAVEVGLDLDQRVVRRHVAKLEAAAWLVREPWVWGEGSVVWLTGAGIEGVRLGAVRPVKSPPGATTIAHGVLVGWSAARVEHRGRVWKSSRELAVERERWAVKARCERGYTELLPDLAVWFNGSEPPVAVITESGGRREDRQKQILEAWLDAMLSGRYSDVHYYCSDASVAHWITRLAKKVGLTGPAFVAEAQLGAEEIAALPPPPRTNRTPASPSRNWRLRLRLRTQRRSHRFVPCQTRRRSRRRSLSHRHRPSTNCPMTQRNTLYTKRSSELNLRRAGDGDADAFQAPPGRARRALPADRGVRIAPPSAKFVRTRYVRRRPVQRRRGSVPNRDE